MRHIWRHPDEPTAPPEPLTFCTCVHKPTRQRYAVLTEDTNVETARGTMCGRAGEYLVEGLNRSLYVLTPAEFAESFEAD